MVVRRESCMGLKVFRDSAANDAVGQTVPALFERRRP